MKRIQGATLPEFKYSVVDIAVDSTEVVNRPALLRGIYINETLSAHDLLIKDNTTTVITIPAESASGTFVNFGDVRFETSLIVDPDNAATGSITLIYKPQNLQAGNYPTI
jgi:hypothetical protein